MTERTLNDNLSKWLIDTVPDDGADTRALLQRVGEYDRQLSNDLEDATNARVNEAIHAAFLLGWQCGRDPDRIVFS